MTQLSLQTFPRCYIAQVHVRYMVLSAHATGACSLQLAIIGSDAHISWRSFLSTTSGSPGAPCSAVAFVSRLFFGCIWLVACVIRMLGIQVAMKYESHLFSYYLRIFFWQLLLPSKKTCHFRNFRTDKERGKMTNVFSLEKWPRQLLYMGSDFVLCFFPSVVRQLLEFWMELMCKLAPSEICLISCQSVVLFIKEWIVPSFVMNWKHVFCICI